MDRHSRAATALRLDLPKLHWRTVLPGIYVADFPHQYVVAIDLQWQHRSPWYVSRWGNLIGGTHESKEAAQQAAEDHLRARLVMNA